jgi:hypothetical protein
VISKATPSFWRSLNLLSPNDQASARRAYRLFSENPAHPSLRFKKLNGHADLWSVRATLSVRAVGHRTGDTITWVWIGLHRDFDKLFA